MRALWTVSLGCLAALGGCVTDSGYYRSEEAQSAGIGGGNPPLSVFVVGNDAAKNTAVAIRRRNDGTLSGGGSFPTGGLGTGGGLGSQGAIALDSGGGQLFAVNAGSGEVSLYEVQRDVLVLRDIVPSGGVRPISLTLREDRLYVLNAGDDSMAGNVTGFSIDGDLLVPIADSTRPLSGMGTAPAQVGLSPRGQFLVVTEKATNNLVTYRVRDDGGLDGPIVTASAGMTPFGFAFNADEVLVVSEAFGGADAASAVSSYRIDDDGVPQVISASVPSNQSAACWVAISPDGRYAYTTNTRSNTISGYRINDDGSVELFDDGGVTAMTSAGPIDLAFTSDGRFLYALDAGDDEIVSMRQRHGGRLEVLETGVSDLPPAGVGLAVR